MLEEDPDWWEKVPERAGVDSEAESVVPAGGGCWTRVVAAAQSPWMLGNRNIQPLAVAGAWGWQGGST